MITCFGEPLVDLFALPIGAGLVEAQSFRPFAGGATLNVALALGRSGVAARFVGALGRDGHGDRIVRELAGGGVDVRGIVRVPRKTGLVFIAVGLDGNRRFLGYADSGAEYALRWEDVEALAFDPLADSDWLVVGSGSLTTEPIAGCLRKLVDRAAASGVPIAVDLNVRPHLWSSREAMIAEVAALAATATVLKGSAEDAEALGLPATIDGLRALAPGAVLAVTHGRDGAELFAAGRSLRRAAEPVDLVDPTGAGDAFTAGLIAELMAREARPGSAAFTDPSTWEAALATACRFGARCVTTLGCTEAFRTAP